MKIVTKSENSKVKLPPSLKNKNSNENASMTLSDKHSIKKSAESEEKFSNSNGKISSKEVGEEQKPKPAKERRHLCPFCGKFLKTSESLVTHMRIHNEELAYTCDSCGKQFRSFGGLYRHQQEVHKRVRNWSCKICQKKFGCRVTRDDHVRTHTGERPYSCSDCGTSFKSRPALNAHKKTHNNQFSYHCFDCDKMFRRRQDMIHHVSIHTGEMKFECQICQKKFRVKAELNRHGLVHTDVKPFQCKICHLHFKQRRYLNRHFKKMHNQKNCGNRCLVKQYFIKTSITKKVKRGHRRLSKFITLLYLFTMEIKKPRIAFALIIEKLLLLLF